MGREGVITYSRALRHRNQTVRLPDGREHTFLVGQEKGVDIRIALDIVRLAHQRAFDVALVFSQDQDLSEVADELRVIAREQGRWIKIASAYPSSPTSRNTRGINGTDWIRIDRATYEACMDSRDYRPKTHGSCSSARRPRFSRRRPCEAPSRTSCARRRPRTASRVAPGREEGMPAVQTDLEPAIRESAKAYGSAGRGGRLMRTSTPISGPSPRTAASIRPACPSLSGSGVQAMIPECSR